MNLILKYNYKLPTQYLLYVIIMITCLVIFINSVCLVESRYDTHIIILKENQVLTRTVSDKFISFGLDTSELRNMIKLPINKKKFLNLVSHLSPAYIRIGGTAADCLYFNKTNINKKLNDDPMKVDNQDISNFIITSSDFFSLYKFIQKTKVRMIFDLNVLIRNPDGSWNDNNAQQIMFFGKSHGMKIDWQLGNEPNSFFHVFNVSIAPKQLAEDYIKLRSLLDALGFKESKVVGPESNHIGDKKLDGSIYVKKFLENVNSSIDYISWHQYYLNGYVAQVQDFVNPATFDLLPSAIESLTKSIGLYTPMWLSETGSAFGGGAPQLSDRFVAGFLWLDKLGYSAKAGIQVIIRQSLYGGHYAMIGPDLTPNPDWDVRLYAHCASEQAYIHQSPTVVIYGMNLNKENTKIIIQDLNKYGKIHLYFLTSNDLQSSNIFLNGELLKLQSNGSLPIFKPKIIQTNQVIVLPGYSMMFLLINNIEIPLCRY